MMRAGAALALGLVLAACSIVRSAPPVRTYRLDYAAPPRNPVVGIGRDQTLRVMPFGIAAGYDRQDFVYRDGEYDIASDYYNRWFAPPASMITDLIARDLAASGQFAVVLQRPSALPAAYELSAQIEEFEERPDGGCSAHLRVRLFLVEAPARVDRRVVFQDLLEADEPCTRGDPDSFVAAMSHAVQRVSMELHQAIIMLHDR